MKTWLVFLIALSCFIFGYYSQADNAGLNWSVGPNQIPSYGLDYTSTFGLGYTDYSVMFNKQMVSPSISFGLQIDILNVGFVAASNIQNQQISGLGGLEFGYTQNLSEKYYVKENNQLLRDTNNQANVSATLSCGVNF